MWQPLLELRARTCRVGFVNEVLPVEYFSDDIFRAPVDDHATLRGETCVSHLDRHGFARRERKRQFAVMVADRAKLAINRLPTRITFANRMIN